MVCITLPDGSRRGYERPFTGTEIALSISPSLARQTVAMVVDGDTRDLSDVIARDASIAFITRDDPRALPLVRHDAAHVLAEAVQELFPGTQATIGPVIENGFYYDFARATPFTIHDLPKIEARMREIVARNRPLTKEIWGREAAKAFFRDRGRISRSSLSMQSRRAKRSRSIARATGSTCAADRTCVPREMSGPLSG